MPLRFIFLAQQSLSNPSTVTSSCCLQVSVCELPSRGAGVHGNRLQVNEERCTGMKSFANLWKGQCHIRVLNFFVEELESYRALIMKGLESYKALITERPAHKSLCREMAGVLEGPLSWEGQSLIRSSVMEGLKFYKGRL